jgi:hypothetical protein
LIHDNAGLRHFRQNPHPTPARRGWQFCSFPLQFVGHAQVVNVRVPWLRRRLTNT